MESKDLGFPNYIDRPRLFLMFEIDIIFMSMVSSGIIGGFVFLATAKALIGLIVMVICVPFAGATAIEARKREGLSGQLYYMRYATGTIKAFPTKFTMLQKSDPELRRMENDRFLPEGFEDEFYS